MPSTPNFIPNYQRMATMGLKGGQNRYIFIIIYNYYDLQYTKCAGEHFPTFMEKPIFPELCT